MSVEERSKAAVDVALARLAERYDEFAVVEKTWEHTPAEQRVIVERFEADRLGGAGVWLTNDAGEVMLVRNEGDDGWGDPGGKVEGDESYERAAVRETAEETGVDCAVTGLREVHVVENRSTDDEVPSAFELIAVFDAEPVEKDPVPRPREGEIAEVGWFAAPPETVLYEEVRERPYPASA